MDMTQRTLLVRWLIRLQEGCFCGFVFLQSKIRKPDVELNAMRHVHSSRIFPYPASSSFFWLSAIWARLCGESLFTNIGIGPLDKKQSTGLWNKSLLSLTLPFRHCQCLLRQGNRESPWLTFYLTEIKFYRRWIYNVIFRLVIVHPDSQLIG